MQPSLKLQLAGLEKWLSGEKHLLLLLRTLGFALSTHMAAIIVYNSSCRDSEALMASAGTAWNWCTDIYVSKSHIYAELLKIHFYFSLIPQAPLPQLLPSHTIQSPPLSPEQFQVRQCPSTDRGKWTRGPPVTKNLFTIKNFWKRNNHFLSMKCHWVKFNHIH